MNQLFGCQILHADTSANDISFEGTQPSLVNDKYGQVKVFAEPHTNLQSYFSQKYTAYLYLWGIPAHPEVGE